MHPPASAPPVRHSRKLDREILGLALPALGTLAADPLVSMVDTAFVGRLGTLPLAALGVNAAVFGLAFVVFNFLAYGTTPRVARALGAGDRPAAGRAAAESLALAGLLGAAAFLLLQSTAVPLVLAMGAGGELQAPTLEYLRVRALAGPAVLLITAGHGIFRGFHDTRTPLLLTLGLNAVNLVLDPIFIFGFGWGLKGAAWATVVAQWAGALAFLWYLLGPRGREYGLPRTLPALRDLLPLLQVGGALGFRTLVLVGTLTVAAAVATRLGTEAVAAHQVSLQIWLFLALVVDALAVAAQAMVAGYRGRGDLAGARAAGLRLLYWGALVGAVLGTAFHLTSPFIPTLFTRDPATVATVAQLLPFVVWMQPLNALVFVWDGIFMGMEEFRFLALQMVLAGAVAAAILSAVLPLDLGLAGVWWALVALMAVRGATLAIRYRSVAKGA